MAYFESSYKNRQNRNLPRRHPWRAMLHVNGRRVSLGYYATQDQAVNVEQKERIRYRQERDE